MGTGLFIPRFPEPSGFPSNTGLRRLPGCLRPVSAAGQVCLPQVVPRIAGLVAPPLAPSAAQRVRNTARRRFLYGWSSRTTIRQMISASIQRLRYLESFAPMVHCEPLHPAAAVPTMFLPSPRTRTLRHLRAALDETSLTNIAPESAVRGLRDPMEIHAPAAVDASAVVAPVWARTEAIRAKLRVVRAADGLFLPQVAVTPLMTNFHLSKAPAETVTGNDRRGVLIPFQELAAAASQSKEMAHSPGLRRLSS